MELMKINSQAEVPMIVTQLMFVIDEQCKTWSEQVQPLMLGVN